jgi:hypothetical protein
MMQKTLSLRAERGIELFQLSPKILSFPAQHRDRLHQSQCAVEEPAFACSARHLEGAL